MKYLTSVMRGEHTEQVLKLIGEGVQTVTDIDVSPKKPRGPWTGVDSVLVPFFDDSGGGKSFQ